MDRENRGSRLYHRWRNESKNFLSSDPPDFLVKSSLSPQAGNGLFVTRAFQTREFLVNYRGDRVTEEASTLVDNVYVFDTGPPEHVLIDAANCKDCIARFINDTDTIYKANCRPVKFRDSNGEVNIAFYSTRNLKAQEELRYDYGTAEAPWKHNLPEECFKGIAENDTSIDLDLIELNTEFNWTNCDLDFAAEVEVACNNAELISTSQIVSVAEQGAVGAICGKLKHDASKEIPPQQFPEKLKHLELQNVCQQTFEKLERKAANEFCEQKKQDTIERVSQQQLPVPETLNENESRETLITNSNDSGETLITNLNDSGKTLTTNSKDSGETLITNSNDSGETLITNSNDSGDTLITNSNDIRENLITNSNDFREKLITNSNDSREEPNEFRLENPDEVIRESPDEIVSRENPDEIVSRENPDEVYSREKPDQIVSRENPDEVNSREKPDQIVSRENPDEVYSREKPDQIGSRENPDEVYSRENPDEIVSRENPDEVYRREKPHENYSREEPVVRSNRGDVERGFDSCDEFPSRKDDDTSESEDEHYMSSKNSKSADRPCSKRSRPRRDKFEECILCFKTVNKMRDHLSNTHKLHNNLIFKRFLSSYYSTRKTKKCFQCDICRKRMSFKHGHPKKHELHIIKERDNIEHFPDEFREAVLQFREQLSTPNEALVQKFVDHQEGLADDGDCVTVQRFSSSLQKFLCLVKHETNDFKETTKLAPFVREYKKSRGLSKASTIIYLSALKKFFTFLELHCQPEFEYINRIPWIKVLEETRVPYQKGSRSERRKMMKEKFLKVPTLKENSILYEKVVAELEKDLKTQDLKYKALLVFNFFILSLRVNCRSGPLLDLTWEDVGEIKRVGHIETSRHKTGHIFDVSITIQDDQLHWLSRMRKQYTKEFQVASEKVFPSSTNLKEHSVARFMREVFLKFFGDEIPNVLEKDFHSNSLRKMWDTYIHKNRDKIPSDLREMHLRQTGHSEYTSQNNYIVPGLNPSLQLYQDVLKDHSSLCENDANETNISTQAQKGSQSSFQLSEKSSNNEHTPKPSQSSSNKKHNPMPSQSSSVVEYTPHKRVGNRNKKKDNMAKRLKRTTSTPNNNDSSINVTEQYESGDDFSQTKDSGGVTDFGSSDDESSYSSFKGREKYVRSLKSFRKYQPTSLERKVISKFFSFEGKFTKASFKSVGKDDVKKMDATEFKRTYDKLKYAINEYLVP